MALACYNNVIILINKYMETTNHNSQAAKFAFFYMLSLVALIFMSLASGMIIFQIINKHIPDVLEQFRGRFSDSQLKFAISALVISAPIFYFTIREIYKNLFTGALNKDSGIRKWLTYLILLVSSVVMIGWMIGTLNSFLDGELTTKFLLKAITAIGIAAAIFSFYFYDIKREEIVGKKDKIISLYFYLSLLVIIAAFVGALFVVESPSATRNRKMDEKIIRNFNQIDSAINNYYNENEKLPISMEVLQEEFNYINDKDLIDPISKEKYEYNVIENRKYELCTVFRTSNSGEEASKGYYFDERWLHDAGKQCLSQKVRDFKTH